VREDGCEHEGDHFTSSSKSLSPFFSSSTSKMPGLSATNVIVATVPGAASAFLVVAVQWTSSAMSEVTLMTHGLPDCRRTAGPRR
jgi:hypothetical protein